MAKYIGRRRAIGIGKESTRGTKVASDFWIQGTEFDFEEQREKVQDESTVGVIEQLQDQHLSKEWAEGSITAPFGENSVGLFLLSLFGSVSSAVADGETIVFEHTYTIAQTNQHQSLTVTLDEPNGDFDFALGMIESFELSVTQGEIISYVVNMKAKKGVAATPTVAYTAENRFLLEHLVFKTATNVAGLTAAPAIKIMSLTLTVEKNLEDQDESGSIEPTDFCNTFVKVSGSLEAVFENETDFKNNALNDTTKAMRIDITNTSITIGNAEKPGIVIDFNKVKFNDFSRSSANDEIVKQTVNFEAFYSLADAKMIQAVLTNTTTSY